MNSIDTTKEIRKSFWLALEQEEQLNHIQEVSKTKVQAIFKNSTRCEICQGEIKEIEELYSYHDMVDIYLLDLLNYRSVSLAIAEKFEIEHQSPQLIVIKDGVVVYYASQRDIDIKELEKFI